METTTTVDRLIDAWGHGPADWGLPAETPGDLTVIVRPTGGCEGELPTLHLQTADEDVPGGGYAIPGTYTPDQVPDEAVPSVD